MADGAPAAPGPTGSRKLRKLFSGALLIVILAGVGWAIVKNRHSFADTVRHVGFGGVALSVLAGLVGIGATGQQWRVVLGGLGVPLSFSTGSRLFFVSQLGKYLPGSVWPIVMQMEAARDRGADRKAVLAGNLITVVLSIATGLLLAGVLLPFSSAAALRRFWWALVALPLVIVLAMPRSLPFLLDRVLSLARRQPLGIQLSSRATVEAAGWATVGWVGQGLQLAVLAASVTHLSIGLLALCIGGMGLAVSAGVLFIPAPAGAGLREVVLGFVLLAVMPTGAAVAVVVASRVILIVVDVLLAALSVGLAHFAGPDRAVRRSVS